MVPITGITSCQHKSCCYFSVVGVVGILVGLMELTVSSENTHTSNRVL